MANKVFKVVDDGPVFHCHAVNDATGGIGVRLLHPHRHGPVPKCDHRVQPFSANGIEDVDEVVELSLVELIGFGFDARPVQSQAKGVEAQRFGAADVVAKL